MHKTKLYPYPLNKIFKSCIEGKKNSRVANTVSYSREIKL